MEMEKLRYSVEKNNFFVKLTTVFLALSVLLQLLSGWGFWKNDDKGYAYMQLLLPILCCILFALIILYGGKKLFLLTSIPVVFGTVFFIVRACGFEGFWRTLLCIAAAVIVMLAYCGTVFGVIRTKWLLPPIFGLTLVYKLFLDKTVSFADMSVKELLPELAVICMLLAMLFIPFAMKKRDFSERSAEEQETIDILMEHEEPTEEEPVTAEREASKNE